MIHDIKLQNTFGKIINKFRKGSPRQWYAAPAGEEG
jgi:hypothetical protein